MLLKKTRRLIGDRRRIMKVMWCEYRADRVRELQSDGKCTSLPQSSFQKFKMVQKTGAESVDISIISSANYDAH